MKKNWDESCDAVRYRAVVIRRAFINVAQRRCGGVAARGARAAGRCSVVGLIPATVFAKHEEAQINEANKRPNESNVGSDF